MRNLWAYFDKPIKLSYDFNCCSIIWNKSYYWLPMSFVKLIQIVKHVLSWLMSHCAFNWKTSYCWNSRKNSALGKNRGHDFGDYSLSRPSREGKGFIRFLGWCTLPLFSLLLVKQYVVSKKNNPHLYPLLPLN